MREWKNKLTFSDTCVVGIKNSHSCLIYFDSASLNNIVRVPFMTIYFAQLCPTVAAQFSKGILAFLVFHAEYIDDR